MSEHLATVRARAPLRLGFAGGGTDLSPYCDEFGGAVINFTINRFAFAFVSLRRDRQIVFRARDQHYEERFDSADELASARLALHRGVYERIVRQFNGGEPLGVTITTAVEAPPGSGLGSSSALVVAMVDAFRTLLDLPLGQYDVAHLAFEIERVDLGFSGGKQDQYASAFGGTNFMEFLANSRVIVNPLRLSSRARYELETSIVTCFSGQSRDSARIIEEQRSSILSHSAQTIEALHRLKQDAVEMKGAVLHGDIAQVGDILDRSWRSKKQTAHSVTNEHLDSLYALAKGNGAIAGKVSGAGGGGFMMFIVRPEDRFQLIEALSAAGGSAASVVFADDGCQSWKVHA
jgi:D-glycero-alpha-D-manno-heptose-7-phosphate kinase